MKLYPLQAVIWLVALAPPAFAAAGAYEINQDCAAVGCFTGDSAGFPVTITQPGSYVLTSDLSVSGVGEVAIQVSAPRVDLDLNNHTIEGGGSCTGVPVSSCTLGPGASAIIGDFGGGGAALFHLHDGTIHGFTRTDPAHGAIALTFTSVAADGSVLESLRVVENGDSATASTAVNFGGSAVAGLVVLRKVQVAYSGGVGVSSVSPLSLAMEDCDILGSRLDGVDGLPAGSTFTGNRFSSNGGFGILSGSGAIALGNNTFLGNNGGGVNPQYASAVVRDMGGNACFDHTPCP